MKVCKTNLHKTSTVCRHVSAKKKKKSLVSVTCSSCILEWIVTRGCILVDSLQDLLKFKTNTQARTQTNIQDYLLCLRHCRPERCTNVRLGGDSSILSTALLQMCDELKWVSQRWPWPLGNVPPRYQGIYHFLIKLCGKSISCVPKVCGAMGLYQYEIIIKPCLINENMTQVSELIYQKEHAIVSDCSMAKDKGQSNALAWK